MGKRLQCPYGAPKYWSCLKRGRILEVNVLDMSFEEEVVKELEKIFGDAGYEADEQALEDNNENLRDFARIMIQLADCIDKAKQRGGIPYLEFEF
jgi:hypothetical protein